MGLHVRVISDDGKVRASGSGDGLAMFDLRYTAFDEGDHIVVESDEAPAEVEVCLDPYLTSSVVWLADGRMDFPVPFGVAREPYGQPAFEGETHWGYVRLLDARERGNWRNLALNSHDLEGAEGAFPHASTNSGATNVRFLARNAIDGVFQSRHHGRWPYESWGINGRDDAWLQVDFGRAVHACELVLFLRADFPHDAWWERARVTCSDGYEAEVSLKRTGAPQAFDIGGRDIEWLRLSDLRKADDPSPWPALSQLMVMGHLL